MRNLQKVRDIISSERELTGKKITAFFRSKEDTFLGTCTKVSGESIVVEGLKDIKVLGAGTLIQVFD